MIWRSVLASDGLNCVPRQSLHVETLSPSGRVFRDRAFGCQSGLDEVTSVRPHDGIGV